MHPTSDSADLNAEQVLALDDAFFGSNPGAYWRSRIDQLLQPPVAPDYTIGLGPEIAATGIDPAMLTNARVSLEDRELQRAIDAFALRHHVAEGLVRLIGAVLEEQRAPGTSVWAHLTTGPVSLHEAVKRVRDLEKSQIPAGALFLTERDLADIRAAGAVSGDIASGLEGSWRWVQHAMDLLDGDGLDANAGNNKVKHGFAVRARDDLRVGLTTTPPGPDGTMPVSAVNDALDIVDSRALEFLERLPRRFGTAAGSWELTVLNLNPGPLLAEALVTATVYAGVFAAAASRHFAGRDLSGPPHPGLVLGPPPEVVRHKATGYRQALTQPSVAGGVPREFTVEVAGQIVGLKRTGEHLRTTLSDG